MDEQKGRRTESKSKAVENKGERALAGESHTLDLLRQGGACDKRFGARERGHARPLRLGHSGRGGALDYRVVRDGAPEEFESLFVVAFAGQEGHLFGGVEEV